MIVERFSQKLKSAARPLESELMTRTNRRWFLRLSLVIVDVRTDVLSVSRFIDVFFWFHTLVIHDLLFLGSIVVLRLVSRWKERRICTPASLGPRPTRLHTAFIFMVG